jgi:phosphate:Na+ symporter
MYDIIGSTVFGTLIYIGTLNNTFPDILGWFTSTWDGPARQVAMFHTLYNLATLFLLLPFVTYIARLMEKIVPVKANATDATYERKLLYLDTLMIKSPAAAGINANNAKLEIFRMGRIAKESFRLSTEAVFEDDGEKAKQVRDYIKTMNYLERKIKARLIEVNGMSVSSRENERIGKMLVVLPEIGKIGDKAGKMIKCMARMKENSIIFSDTEIRELKMLGNSSVEIVSEALDAYEKDDKSKLSMIKSQRKIIKSIKATCVENHMERFKDEHVKPEGLAVFSDIIKNLERGAEHAKDIADEI